PLPDLVALTGAAEDRRRGRVSHLGAADAEARHQMAPGLIPGTAEVEARQVDEAALRDSGVVGAVARECARGKGAVADTGLPGCGLAIERAGNHRFDRARHRN